VLLKRKREQSFSFSITLKVTIVTLDVISAEWNLVGFVVFQCLENGQAFRLH